MSSMVNVGKVTQNSMGAREMTKGDRNVGIEIEIENVPAYFDTANEAAQKIKATDLWYYKKDGSLRNFGVEFLTPPTPKSKVPKALDWFYRACASGGWQPSERTGIHVHVDARDYTMDNIQALCAVYCLVEPALFNFVGKEREEGIFCVPWYRSDSDVLVLQSGVKSYSSSIKEFLMYMTPQFCKYSAFYLEPLSRYGTVEFRHAPTFYSQNKLQAWVDVCARIVDWVKTSGQTAEQVMETYREGPMSLIEDVLQDFPLPHNYPALLEETDSDYLALRCAGIKNGAKWLKMEKHMKVVPPAKTPNLPRSKVKIPEWLTSHYTMQHMAVPAAIQEAYAVPDPVPLPSVDALMEDDDFIFPDDFDNEDAE